MANIQRHNLEMRKLNSCASGQGGAALFVALVMLLLLTILGLSASNSGILQERMVANSQEAQLAFERAEAGLRQIEALTQKSSFGGIPRLVQPFDITMGGTFEANDCSLSVRTDQRWDDLDWQPSTELRTALTYVTDWGNLGGDQSFSFDFVILDLQEFIDGSSNLPRFACRFAQEMTDGFGRSRPPDFYIILARATSRSEGRPARAVVQSIYWWPSPSAGQ